MATDPMPFYSNTLPCPVGCPHCQTLVDLAQVDQIRAFVWHEPIACPNCREGVDLWGVVLELLQLRQVPWHVFAAIGASQTALTLPVEVGGDIHIDFVQYGVPADAVILDINCTAVGAVRPLVCHSNNLRARSLSTQLYLHIAALEGHAPPAMPALCVAAYWVAHTAEDAAWRSLVWAFDAYASGSFEAMIVPANVAVELPVAHLLNSWLCETAPSKRVADFLKVDATYSAQLNVLLPQYCKLRGYPAMPDRLRGSLNRLRDLRNEIAHTGSTAGKLSEAEAAQLLRSAIFGFRYASLTTGRR